MKAMYRRWFQYPDGSLKTSRMSVAVFVAVLVGLGMVHEASQSKDTLLVQVFHVFEPETEQKATETVQKAPGIVKKRIEATPVEAQQNEDTQSEAWASPPAPVPEPRESVVKPMPEKPFEKARHHRQPGVEMPAEPAEPAEPVEAAGQAVEPAIGQAATGKEAIQVEDIPPESDRPDAVETTDEMFAQIVQEEMRHADLRVSLPGMENAKTAGKGIEMDPEEYAALYEKWRRSGEALAPDGQGVSLRIMDLEQVYDLFQMKVVAFRGQTPFMDLADNTRVAPQALVQYSGTCFVVTRPWEKWGNALARAGFRKNDAVEVRYYIYDFVRNAIFARAARAVAWSVAAGPAGNADLSKADVLGRVFGVNRSGGGAFGVFVPVQVDFASGMSVSVDPLACFPDEPDILALNQAGLL